MSEKSSFDIFIGTDMYGRGTYGGGQLETYKAINMIGRYQLSIAIFGSGYI